MLMFFYSVCGRTQVVEDNGVIAEGGELEASVSVWSGESGLS